MKNIFRWAVVMVSVFLVNSAFASTIHIVAFGGSNTYGKNLERASAYPYQLEIMLKAEGYDVEVKNEGVNGDTTADELARLENAIPPGTDIVIFQPGGNDGKKRSGGNTGENIQKIVSQLLARKIGVICSGNEKRLSYISDLDVLTIDEINKLAGGYFQNDGQHLTAEGYKIVAEKMLPLVKQLIAKIKAK